MKYAAYDSRSGTRVILSVHTTRRSAVKAMWKLWGRMDGLPYGVTVCPDHKKKGDILTFAEIMSAAGSDPPATT